MTEVEIPKWQKKCKYTFLKNLEDFPGVPDNIEYVAIDIETEGFDRVGDRVVGLSISFREKEAYYISVMHEDSPCVTEQELADFLNHHFNDKTVVYWNAIFDRSFLRRIGFVANKERDAQIMAYVVDTALCNELRGRLKTYAKRLLGVEMLTFREAMLVPARKVKNEAPLRFNTRPVDDIILAYTCADADCTFRLFNKFVKQGVFEKKFRNVLKIDHAFLDGIEYMEDGGIYIDIPTMEELRKTLQTKSDGLEATIRETFGQDLNLSSPKQLGKVLYEDLRIAIPKHTPTGQPSTDKETLDRLFESCGDQYPGLSLIRDWREVQKKLSSYVCPILNGLSAHDGRIHPHYNSTSLITGRLSSSGDGVFLKKLNVQAVPKDLVDKDPLSIRNMFTTPEDSFWLSIDLSNIELRIIAHESQDPRMLEVYHREHPYDDLHGETAKLVFGGVPGDIRWPELRKNAKIVNFNAAYAFSTKELAKKLKMPRYKAQDYFNRLFKHTYPVWGAYKERTRKIARKTKMVRTFYGRHISLKKAYSVGQWYGDNRSVNYPIQGTCADFMRLAIAKCYKFVKQENLFDKVKFLSTIHDEINFEIKGRIGDPGVDQLIVRFKEIMEFRPAKFSVPVVADVTVGPTWSDQYKWVAGKLIGDLERD